MRKVGWIVMLLLWTLLTGCGVLTMYGDSYPDGRVLYDGYEEEQGRLAEAFMEMGDKSPDFPSEERTLYYQTGTGYLVPVRRHILKQENPEKATVIALIGYPITHNEIRGYGLYPVLPSELKVLELGIKNGIAHVDMNDAFITAATKEQERNMIVSIVYTLTSFDTIQGVSFTVNGGNTFEMPFDSNVTGVLTRQNTLINNEKLNVTQGYAKFDAYMWLEDDFNNRWCLPVSKQVESMTQKDHAFLIFDSMNEGRDSLETALPLNTRLEDSKTSANTLILDFNGNLLNYSGLDKEMELISQIYLAATQIEGVENVVIKAEGKKIKLKEGTNVSGGLFLADYVNRIDR